MTVIKDYAKKELWERKWHSRLNNKRSRHIRRPDIPQWT